MIFYPKSYFNNILEIDINFLLKNHIKAIFLDVDNTLIDYEHNLVVGLEGWIENLKKCDIKFCILSNTYNKQKVKRIAKLLDIPYIYLAKKPLKFGFKKAKKILQIENNNQIAVVGDQVLTDVLGANRCKMHSILVAPLKNKDIFVTRFNRLIEKQILKKYFNTKEDKKKTNVEIEKR